MKNNSVISIEGNAPSIRAGIDAVMQILNAQVLSTTAEEALRTLAVIAKSEPFSINNCSFVTSEPPKANKR